MADGINGFLQGSAIGPTLYTTKAILKVSTTEDLGIVLNTRHSAEDNVITAAYKACKIMLYLKRSFATLTPSVFLPL